MEIIVVATIAFFIITISYLGINAGRI